MANYVTNVSDKRRGTLLLLWCICMLGMFPLYYWYVGRKIGVLRLLTMNYFMFGAISDLGKILFGSFRDNVGYPIRQW